MRTKKRLQVRLTLENYGTIVEVADAMGFSMNDALNYIIKLRRERTGYIAPEETISALEALAQKRTITAELRWQVWLRDDFTCKQCGSRQFLSVDHIKPGSKGGETELNNLQTLCRSCNSKKGVKE